MACRSHAQIGHENRESEKSGCARPGYLGDRYATEKEKGRLGAAFSYRTGFETEPGV
jgi:hypothetical protein